MTTWDFAAAWDGIAQAAPTRPAFEHGSLVRTWKQFVDRAARLAGAFVEAGLGPSSRVGILLRNQPEWMETYLACLWIGAVPFNINWRYREPELCQLLDDAPVAALVVAAEFALAVRNAAREAESPPPVTFTVYEGGRSSYEHAVAHPRLPRRANTGEEIIDLYTGGTTGAPKAVMWRQEDLWEALATFTGRPAIGTEEAVTAAASASGPRTLIACPLMHGTGLFMALQALSLGGTVITVSQRHFDPGDLVAAVARHRPQVLSIVGDAFARPLVDFLEHGAAENPLEGLIAIVSSGVTWSAGVKDRLLRIAPGRLLIDALSSSEAIGVASADPEAVTGRFRPGVRTRVVDDQMRPCPPGEEGWIAIGPPNPLGYRNDPAKSSATFRVVDTERWCVPGDRAMLDNDGTLVLLGRDSACINTGGEKVHAEEVEEVLKLHPGVADAAVVGIPDQRLGAVVAAVIELVPSVVVDESEIRRHARERLAGYKVPLVVMFDAVARQASGKLDYPALRARLSAEAVTK